MLIEFTTRNVRPLTDKMLIMCCGEFLDEDHWGRFKQIEASRGWVVRSIEPLKWDKTPNALGNRPPREAVEKT